MAEGAPPITVLVADGQRLFAESVGVALAGFDDIEVIREYPATGGDTVDAVKRCAPDVTLLDYWIPGMRSTVAVSAIQEWAGEEASHTRVLVVSWLYGPQQVQEAVDAGVAGFLPRSIRLDQLVDAIRQAHAGMALVFAKELAKLVSDIDKRHIRAQRRLALLRTLTPREVQVLQALSFGRPRELVAEDCDLSVGTLKNYVHKILNKIECRDLLEAVALTRYLGIIKEVGYPEDSQTGSGRTATDPGR